MVCIAWCWFAFGILLQTVENEGSPTWPYKSYTLLKPRTGCPDGWDGKGYLYQDTIDKNPSNNRSETLHIDGEVACSHVKRYFCSKTDKKGHIWPSGQYCVYRHKTAEKRPHGVKAGSIVMYGEKHDNNDEYKFTKFRVDIKKRKKSYEYTRLYYACRRKGNTKFPISLPITKPFYLLPYGSRDCQQVEWMVATSEWIKYHTNNYDTKSVKQSYGAVPYHELGDRKQKGITMYYCYYESCNYTLNDTSGVFQSPGFPGKYPDGQLCSWRIMVPDNHNLHVHFTNFSLYEYDRDSLRLYDNNNGIFEPRYALFGNYRPFTITATSHLMFVFRSDEENNSTGFSANYTLFKTPYETTTTSKPPTTTSPPTTTTQPTTKLTTTQPPTTKQPTTKLPTTTEATTTYPPTTNVNWTTNETVNCSPTKGKSYDKHFICPSNKTWYCDETWRIVVMVIPLAVFILIVLVIIDIFCRYRYKKGLKSKTTVLSPNGGMVVNPTYERGSIIIDHPTDTVSNETTAANKTLPRDEPTDYEDVDYTQVDEIPPPRRSMKRQECHALQPVGNGASAVFYHVLEPPMTESQNQPQSRVPEPGGKGAPEVFYHTLEPPTDLSKPTYQNLSEVSHCTLNPLYESAENSLQFVEANNMDNHYIA